MLEATPTVGSVETSLAEKRRLARLSPQWNRKTAIFCELFPDLVQPESADAPAEEGEYGPAAVLREIESPDGAL